MHSSEKKISVVERRRQQCWVWSRSLRQLLGSYFIRQVLNLALTMLAVSLPWQQNWTHRSISVRKDIELGLFSFEGYVQNTQNTLPYLWPCSPHSLCITPSFAALQEHKSCYIFRPGALASDGWGDAWRPSPKCSQEPLVATNKDGRPPRGPPGGALPLIMHRWCIVWGLLGV